MFRKQTFDNNIYMKLIRWLYILLMINLGLTLTNLPFFFAANFLAIAPQNAVWFLLAFWCFGPSMLAALATLDAFKRDQDIEPFKAFFTNYTRFARAGWTYWTVGLVTVVVAFVDSRFFAKLPYGQWLLPFFLVLVIITFGVILNLFYFRIRNQELGFKEIFKISVYYALKKWYASLLNSCLMALIPLVMIVKPQFGFFLTPVLFLGIIYLNCGQLHKISQRITE